MRHRMLVLALCSAAGLAVIAACGGGSKRSATSTPTTSNTTTAATTPGGSATAPVVEVSTPELPTLSFARTPLEGPEQTGTEQATLTNVQVSDNGDYDQVLFQFQGGLPGYHIDYITGPPTSCGSGETVQVSGQAFLEVRTFRAVAHDESGLPTFPQTSTAPDLPVLKGLVRSCDFEGVVTWVLGVSQPVDFAAIALSVGYLAVDVKHP